MTNCVTTIKELIARNQVKSAIGHLKTCFPDRQSEIVLLERDYSDIENEELAGVFTPKELTARMSILSRRILKYMDVWAPVAVVSTANMLFLSAVADQARRVGFDHSFNNFSKELKKETSGEQFSLHPCLAATPDDLVDAMDQFQPKVLHFAGHGSAEGIHLLDEGRSPVEVSGKELSKLIDIVGKPIELIFLNACYTLQQAEDLAGNPLISCVVTVENQVPDFYSIAFALRFYRHFFSGKTIPDAFKRAKWSIEQAPDYNPLDAVYHIHCSPKN